MSESPEFSWTCYIKKFKNVSNLFLSGWTKNDTPGCFLDMKQQFSISDGGNPVKVLVDEWMEQTTTHLHIFNSLPMRLYVEYGYLYYKQVYTFKVYMRPTLVGCFYNQILY